MTSGHYNSSLPAGTNKLPCVAAHLWSYTDLLSVKYCIYTVVDTITQNLTLSDLIWVHKCVYVFVCVTTICMWSGYSLRGWNLSFFIILSQSCSCEQRLKCIYRLYVWTQLSYETLRHYRLGHINSVPKVDLIMAWQNSPCSDESLMGAGATENMWTAAVSLFSVGLWCEHTQLSEQRINLSLPLAFLF